jgi:hypothetical protein
MGMECWKTERRREERRGFTLRYAALKTHAEDRTDRKNSILMRNHMPKLPC